MPRINWTQKTIDYLRKSYSEGVTDKEMARHLGRSRESVNKALTRHKIRGSRDMASIIQRAEEQRQRYKRLPLDQDVCDADHFDLPQFVGDRRMNWAPFETVLRYLIANGVSLTKTGNAQFPYCIGQKWMTRGQVLLHCNRRRYRENLDIIHVPFVTEC